MVKKKLSNNIEFKRVFSKGTKEDCNNLKIFILKNHCRFNRLGVVIKKEVGKAAIRNKIKRRLKEAYRHIDKKLSQGYDIIIFVKKNAVNLKYFKLYEELERILITKTLSINGTTNKNVRRIQTVADQKEKKLNIK